MVQFTIIGAGFAGLTAAYFLKKHGFEVLIIENKENRSQIHEKGGGITIFPNGMNILRKIGVSDSIIKDGYVLEKAELCDHNGIFLANHDLGNKKNYNEPTVAIKRKSLYKILSNHVSKKDVKIIYGKKLLNIIEKEKYVKLCFEGNFELKSNYVIGADGIHSTVRNHIYKKSFKLKFDNVIYFAGLIKNINKIKSFTLKDKTQHIAVGQESFFAYNISNTSDTGEKSLIWFTFMKQDSLINSKSNDHFINEILAIQKDWHIPTKNLIDSTEYFSKANIYEMIDVPNWSTKRTIIIGDAAHAMSPMAGQGACTAIEDGEMIGYLCKFHKNNAFQLFEKIRRNRVKKIANKGNLSSKISRIKVTGKALIIRNFLYSMRQKFTPEILYNKVYNYTIEDELKKYNL